MFAVRTRVGGVGLAIAATGLLLAGCGGSSSSSQSSGGSAQSSALQAYVTCMQQNGVTLSVPSGGPNGGGGASGGPGGVRPSGAMPSGAAPSGAPGGAAPSGGPGGGGGAGFLQKPSGVDDATWQKATAACASLLPSSGTANSANQAYQNCLQEHGVTATASPDAATEQTCSVLKPTATPSS